VTNIGSRRLDFVLLYDPLRLLGKPPLCWISSFTKIREVIVKVIVASTSKVTLVLHLVRGFARGC
jgi:hypothetical protein